MEKTSEYENEKSVLIRGTSKCARFFICDTKEIVKKAKAIHNLDPIGTMIFGKFITVAGMIGKDLKGEGDLVTLKITGDGPYGNMLATGNSKGEVKGYMGDPSGKLHQIIDEKGDFIVDDTGKIRFIGNGTFQMIKDLGLKEPFSGMIQLEYEDMGDIIADYFFLSDQIKSAVSLAVKLYVTGEVINAGGYIIQLLPGVEEGFIDKLEDKLRQIRSITELLAGGFTLERIADLLYEDISVEENEALMEGAHKKMYVEDFEILEKSFIEYKCNCSREKYFKGVLTLGKKEIDEILEEEGKIQVECHFCGKKYEFIKSDFSDWSQN